MRRLIIGISGAVYGIRALQALKNVADIEAHLKLFAKGAARRQR